jgi:hypothetical protein
MLTLVPTKIATAIMVGMAGVGMYIMHGMDGYSKRGLGSSM